MLAEEDDFYQPKSLGQQEGTARYIYPSNVGTMRERASDELTILHDAGVVGLQEPNPVVELEVVKTVVLVPLTVMIAVSLSLSSL